MDKQISIPLINKFVNKIVLSFNESMDESDANKLFLYRTFFQPSDYIFLSILA